MNMNDAQSRNDITTQEAIIVAKAQEKWWPALVPTYSTTILDLMANPLKKALITLIVYYILAFIYFKFYKLNKNDMRDMGKWIVLISLGVFIITYYEQWKKNENLVEVALRLPDRFNSRNFDFKNNMVVQGEMFRRSGVGLEDVALVSALAGSKKGRR